MISEEQARQILEERLLSHRIIDEMDNWIWTKSCRAKGYGQTSFPGGTRNVAVHRVAAWLWLDFDLWSDLCVLHHCDTPPCFNPEHLFIGTVADNQTDMASKGRSRNVPQRGEAHRLHKLTEDKIRVIRFRRASGEKLKVLAAEYEVTETLICNIAKGKTWKHVI